MEGNFRYLVLFWVMGSQHHSTGVDGKRDMGAGVSIGDTDQRMLGR